MKLPTAALLAFLLGGAAAGLGVTPEGTKARRSSSSAILEKAGKKYWEFLQRESIGLRLRLGLPIETLPDPSLAKARADAAFGRSLLRELEAVREADLGHEERLSLAVVRHEARQLVEAADHYWLVFPVTPYTFAFFGAHEAFTSHRFRGREDADRYVALLSRYAVFIGELEKKLREQSRRGIFLPKVEIPVVVGLFEAVAKEKEQSLFWVKAERTTSLSNADRDALTTRSAAAIASQINPALRSLIGFLSGDYRNRAAEAVGLSQYPGGKDYYRFLVRLHTTLELSPEEIHRIGLAEVERLNAELDAMREKVGFRSTSADFRRFLKTDERFFPKTPEEVGERLMAAQNRITAKIPEFFGKVPKAPYGVKRLEHELEGAMTFGYYQIPTAADPKGYYKYNGSNLKERTLLGAGSLVAHELVPGHHFQINLQYENEKLPKFRQEVGYGAFVEGWAEYAASLAGEMGMYEDPYDWCGRLADDLFLATRLVVDTGMNALGWPRSRAIEYMKQNTLGSETEIDTETLRYACDIPGQALGYKLGRRKIEELRKEAQKALGPAFDIREFHDVLLGSGALPLDVLEGHIRWFIAEKQRRSPPQVSAYPR